MYAEPPCLEGPRDVAEFIEHYQVLEGLDAQRITLTVRPEPEAAARTAHLSWGYRPLTKVRAVSSVT
ncbi:hypothetical protein [Streptomyces flaveolus]|uniref:hypothetical protein n=1 Tax=Streptomyces flaveolus TaxID=67297 RepID=UPI003F53F2E6